MALLILVLIKGFIHALGWLCTFYSLPTLLFYALVKVFLMMNKSIKDSGSLHFFIWLPRWVIVSMMIPIWVGQSAALGYLLYYLTDSLAITIPCGIGAFIVSIIGVIYSQKSKILSKIAPEIKIGGDEGYFDSFCEAQADLFAALSFLISLCSVIRIPFMTISLTTGKPPRTDSLRTEIFVQLAMTFVDIMTLPFALLLALFVWRWPKTKKHWKKEAEGSYEYANKATVRWIVILQALNGLADIPVFTLGFLVTICLAPWRLPLLLNNLAEKDTIGKRRKVIVEQFLAATLDFLCILACIPVVVTLYRLIPMIYCVAQGSKASHRRKAALWHLAFLIFDIFTILPAIIIVLTVYRLPKLYRKAKSKPFGFLPRPGGRRLSEPEVQGTIWVQFGRFLRDLPYIICGVFVTLLLWRAIFLFIDLYKAKKNKDRRSLAAHHFVMVFVDIIDIPFACMAFIMTITVWRAHRFWVRFKESPDRNEKRWTTTKQFFYWFLDIPTAICALLVFCSIYRAKRLYNLLIDYRKSISSYTTSAPATSPDDEENPSPKKAAFSWHIVVAREFGELVLDIPFPILILLCLWRMPWTVKAVISDECPDARSRRLRVLKTLILILKDIPCSILVLLMVVTFWRIPSIVRATKEYKRGDNEHRIIIFLFFDWLIDIPFILLGSVVLLTLWRFPYFVRTILKKYKKNPDTKAWRYRQVAAEFFGIIWVDVLIVIFAIFVFVTFIRLPTFIYSLRSALKGLTKPVRFERTIGMILLLFYTTLLILSDIMSLIQIVFIFVGILHVPSFFVRCYNLLRASNDWRLPYEEGYARRDFSRVDDKTYTYLKEYDYHYMIDQLQKENIQGAPALTLFRRLIIDEFLDTLKHLPHLANIPLKIGGFLFMPLYYYIRLRTSTRRARIAGAAKKDELTFSFFSYPLIWIYMVSESRLNIWGCDQIFILNMVSIVFVLPSELALLAVVPNLIFLTVITFGDPFWRSKRLMLGWGSLGGAPGGIFTVFETIILAIQVVAVPAFLFLQVCLLLLPMIVASVFYFDTLPSASTFFEAFFTRAYYWSDVIRSMDWWIWVIQAYWIFIMLATWHITFRIVRKKFNLFNPLVTYLWLVQRVFAGTIWRFYSSLLSHPTRWCYTKGALGQVIMLFLFPIWAYWSVIIPIVLKNYFTLIGVIPVCLFLTWRGYYIMSLNWKEYDPEALKRPVCKVTYLRVELPEDGGMIMHIRGVKPRAFILEQARLLLEGDEFWRGLSLVFSPSVISAAKMTLYPLILCPTYMDPITTISSEELNIKIRIPSMLMGKKVKKSLIVKNINKIIKTGDHPFTLKIEHGQKKFGWNLEGVLLEVPGLKLSNFIESAESGRSIFGGDIEEGLQPAQPNVSAPVISKPSKIEENPNFLVYVTRMQELGYEMDMILNALSASGGDVDRAANYLMDANQTVDRLRTSTITEVNDSELPYIHN